MENDERKNDEKRKKIDKILNLFDSNGVIIVDKKSIGKVGLEEVSVNEDWVSECLLDIDFTEREINELLQFFKRVGWLLIDADSIGYVSIDECKVNRDLIYDSVKF